MEIVDYPQCFPFLKHWQMNLKSENHYQFVVGEYSYLYQSHLRFDVLYYLLQYYLNEYVKIRIHKEDSQQ